MNRQRKSRSFTPGVVDSLEDRVVQSGFKFPTELGPVQTLGYRGNYVLTSRTYAQVQREVDRAIKAFGNQFLRGYDPARGLDAATDKALGTVAGGMGGGAGVYKTGMLAQVDRIMARVETRLPFGRGLAGSTGGVGLSTYTSTTSLSNASGLSVAEQLDLALNSGNGPLTRAQVRDAIESVRQEALNIAGRGVMAGVNTPGILPSYIATFGPGGTGDFGLKNS